MKTWNGILTRRGQLPTAGAYAAQLKAQERLVTQGDLAVIELRRRMDACAAEIAAIREALDDGLLPPGGAR